MTMTFERLRFAGWHHDHGTDNDIRRIIYVQSGASMDIIDCIFEDNTVPMSAVYHVGGGPLLVASSIFRNANRWRGGVGSWNQRGHVIAEMTRAKISHRWLSSATIRK